MNTESQESARLVIEQLWYRARINAFAHRAAADEASRSDKNYFQHEMLATLLSILCVISVYILSTDVTPTTLVKVAKILFTVASISLTLCALYQRVMASYLKFDIHAEGHRHLLNSYQYIAQRAREAKWPDLPHDELINLLKELEREFQLLKVRGSEPEDRHFEAAHAIVGKIRKDADIRIAQSFEIGIIDAAAQHVGDPKEISLSNDATVKGKPPGT